jgi:membrane dipeptidase
MSVRWVVLLGHGRPLASRHGAGNTGNIMRWPSFLLTLVTLFAPVSFSTAAESSAENSSDELDPALLAQVREILREVPLIDGHNDLPWQYRKQGNDLDAIDLTRDTSILEPPLVTDFPRLRAGGVGGQFWSVYVPASMAGPEAVKAVLEQIDVVHRLVARYPDQLELALTAEDVVRIHRAGRIASLIGMEGGHSIDNSLGALRMMHELGARYMTLTHNDTIDWADSATDDPRHGGLNEFGVQVVREMNRLGMLVDLSHVAPETMHDALDASQAPVIFSHSSARGLCDHPRNVPDDVLRRLPENGGVVMVCFLPGYLTEIDRERFESGRAERDRLEALYPADKEKVDAGIREWRRLNPRTRATLSHAADHIDYIRQVAGIDHLGIGADYEGFSGPPEGLEDVSTYPALLAELLKRGYSEDDIRKIAGLNVLRVMRATENVARDSSRRQR